MNCRYLNKFMCNKINLKSMSTYKQAKPEQLYCCFNKDPHKTVRSVKFVPKQEPLKVPAEKYHESNSQAIISKRMINLHKTHKMGGGESQILSKRLQNLINSGQRSFMNFSTKKNVKSRHIKNLNRHRLGSSSSITHNNFATRKSNNLLNKVMLSYSQKSSKNVKGNENDKFTYVRPAISGRNISIPRRNFTVFNERIKKDKLALLARAKREALREKHDKADSDRKAKDNEEEAAESLEIALNIRDKLEDLSLRIKNDLMSIDGSLKERLSVMKKKYNNPPKHQQAMAYGAYSEEYESPAYHEELDLMPVQRKRSALSEITEHSKRLQYDKEEPIIGVVPKAGIDKERRDMYKKHSLTKTRPITTATNEQPFSFNLMQVNKNTKPHFSSLQENNPEDHIIQITTKDAADAEGIYYAPKHTN